jgi:hypothetical protein
VIEANSSYNTFSTNYQNLFEKYFPYVRMSRKAFKDKPYITRGIKNSIKYKNKLLKNTWITLVILVKQFGKDLETRLMKL